MTPDLYEIENWEKGKLIFFFLKKKRLKLKIITAKNIFSHKIKPLSNMKSLQRHHLSLEYM